MLIELVMIYLAGWVFATLGIYLAGRRYSDERDPALHPFGLSVVAGAVWPLLVVGLVELSSVVVFTKMQSKLDSSTGIVA